jgi:hypothetical protein
MIDLNPSLLTLINEFQLVEFWWPEYNFPSKLAK